MKKFNEIMITILIWTIILLITGLLIACVVLWFVAQIKYAFTPVKDIPVWAYMFIGRN